ncbi:MULTISPECIES: ABC transporter permease [Actinomadura]|uniref:ABC transporter permease subunit n=1 Tax=Actinomadura litoris TaxID=2678616 RepID=A0A7K1KZT0_9ACTN|nr:MULTISPECIES: ABC transporter permease [Actinomadura]MBT2211808.1 ABC transporter permease [Actinomadura sp. NEAU-AAG7]MUN37698.1 ABC transporter permease subunit [Actinomadura litoris]
MTRFLLRRLLYAVIVLWLVSTLVFVFLHVSPIPVERVIGGPRATADTLAQIRRNLGLDQPVLVQYWRFLRRLAGGDLGDSYVNGVPVARLIGDRLPTTLWLVLGAGLLACGGGVVAGVLSATRARSLWDRAATVLVLLGLSTPPFVMALALLYLFAGGIGGGSGPFEAGPPLQEHFLRRMVLPWVALAFLMVAAYTRLTRGALLDVLGEDYVRTAKAKGLTRRRVVYRHGLRAALTPVVTQLGVDLGALVGSTIVTEKVFGLQGVGQLVYQSIALGDTPVIIGVTLVVTLFVTLANLAVDVGYSLLDPRVRSG